MASLLNNNCDILSTLVTLKEDFNRELSQLKQGKKKWREVELKVSSLESELRASQNEVGNLRSALLTERERWREGEESTRKMKEAIEELKRENARMEIKVFELEERTPPLGGGGGMGMGSEMLNNMVNELIQAKFGRLQEEVEGLRQIVAPTDPLENENVERAQILSDGMVEGEEEEGQEEFEDEQEEEQFVEMEEEDDEEPMPLPLSMSSVGLGPPLASPPAVSVAPSQNEGDTNGDSSFTSTRSSKWNQPHEADPSDPTGTTCLCGSTHTSLRNLTDHITYFTAEWKFTCQFCDKRFVAYNRLRNHLKIWHNKVVKGGDKSVGCGKCCGVFPSRLQYRKHLKKCKGRVAAAPAPSPGPSKATASTSTKSRARTSTSTPSKKTKTAPGPGPDPLETGQGPVTPEESHGKAEAGGIYLPFMCLCKMEFVNEKGLNTHIKYFANQSLPPPPPPLPPSPSRASSRPLSKVPTPAPTTRAKTARNRNSCEAIDIGEPRPSTSSAPAPAPAQNPNQGHGPDPSRKLYCLCGLKFPIVGSLLRHIKYYTKQTLLCRYCDKRFAYNCYLKVHVAKAHKNVFQVKVEGTEVWAYE